MKNDSDNHARPQPVVNPLPAACNMNDVNRHCGRYQQQLQQIAQTDLGNTDKVCCVIHEQISCFQSLNCPAITGALIGAVQAQIPQMCPRYVYTPGCADTISAEEPEHRRDEGRHRVLPPNYAKCVNITNATPDTVVVIATFQDDQGQREKSSAIEAGGEYQFPAEERQVRGRRYRTAIPLNKVAVVSSIDGELVEEIISATGVQDCISRTIAYNPSTDGYMITESWHGRYYF